MDTHHRVEAVIDRLGERAWRLARSLTGNAADADDVVQGAWLVAIRKIGQTREGEEWSWLARVIVLEARKLSSGKRRGSMAGHDEPFTRDAPVDAAMAQQELSARLARELTEIPHEEREALTVVHIDGLTQRQAAEVLGVSAGMVNRRVQSGISRLRKRLAPSERDLAYGLGAIPLGMPKGGFVAAKVAWKAGLAASLSPSNTVVLLGVVTMNKIIAASIAVALLLALGVVWVMHGDTGDAAAFRSESDEQPLRLSESTAPTLARRNASRTGKPHHAPATATSPEHASQSVNTSTAENAPLSDTQNAPDPHGQVAHETPQAPVPAPETAATTDPAPIEKTVEDLLASLPAVGPLRKIGTLPPWHTGVVVRDIATSPDGTWVATINGSNVVHLRDASSGMVAHEWKPGSQGKCLWLRFTPDSRSLLVSTAKGVEQYDVSTYARIRVFSVEKLNAAALSRDGLTLAAISDSDSALQSTLFIWTTESEVPLSRITLAQQPSAYDLSSSVALSSDGRMALITRIPEIWWTRDGEKALKAHPALLWSSASAPQLKEFGTPSCGALAAHFFEEDRKVSTFHSDGTIRVWNTWDLSLEVTRNFSTPQTSKAREAQTPATQARVFADLWPFADGRRSMLSWHRYYPTQLDLSTLQASDTSMAVETEPLKANKSLLFSMDGHCLALSPDEHYVYVCNEVGRILKWDIISGKLMNPPDKRIELDRDLRPLSIDLSADGRLLASVCANAGSGDHPVLQVIDTETGSMVKKINYKTRNLSQYPAVRFSSSGTSVFIVDGGTLRDIDMHSDTERKTVLGWADNGGCESIAILSSPDRLLLSSRGGEVVLLDSFGAVTHSLDKIGKRLAPTIFGPDGLIIALRQEWATSPDGGEGYNVFFDLCRSDDGSIERTFAQQPATGNRLLMKYLPTSRQLVFSTHGGQSSGITLYDVSGARPPRILADSSDTRLNIGGFVVTYDERYLVGIGPDPGYLVDTATPFVVVWDLGTGELVKRFDGLEQLPTGVALSKSGLLAVTQLDTIVWLWDLERELGR